MQQLRPKLLLVMLLLCMQAFASPTLTQTVDINLTNATLTELFKAVERQTPYRFSYKSSDIDSRRDITVKRTNATVASILSEVLPSHQLVYKILSNNTIAIIKVIGTPKERMVPASTQQQSKHFEGTITDTKGEPIVGASVLEAGTTNGTVTDLNGHYSLNVHVGAKITVTYVGFVSQTIAAKGGEINITLYEDQQSLNEVVVVGYGMQKKVDLTGSIASISEKDLDARPITSVSAGIQGLAPGVTVLNASGKPGEDGGSFQIRGKGTLNNSDPYILVDGVETGTIDAIDPSDIESISVLKDAASSAIYGSKAANGVILITTKRGKEGRAKINYNGSMGFQKPTYLLEKMHSYDYARMYNKALTDAGKSPRFSDEEIQKFRDGSDPYNYPDTRWYDLAFKTGILTKHNINVTGGSDKVHYMVSGGYLYQKGTMRNSDRDQFNMRSNIDMKVSGNLTLRANMAYIHNNFSQPIPSYAVGDLSGGIFHQLSRIAPWIPYKYEDGSYGSIGDGNPVAWLDADERMRNHKQNLSITVAGDWKVYKDLTLTARGNFVSDINDGTRYMKAVKYRTGSHGPNALYEYDNLWQRYDLDLLLNWSHNFGFHHMKALAGYNAEWYNFKQLTGSRNTFPNNDIDDLNAGASSTQTNSGYTRQLRLMSYFGRINYDWKDRYLFEANLRVDGSSRFATGHRWGYFPSFSAGWRVSEEPFLAAAKASWLENLKIRASWGQLGNQDALDEYYPWLATYSIGRNFPFGGTLATGVTQTAQKLSTISWETTTNVGVGFDMSFLKYFNFTFDWYQRTTKDIIMAVPVPATFGMGAYDDNIGKVRNSGIEVTAEWQQSFGDWTFGITANFAYNKNEILDLGGVNEMIDGYFINRVGEPYHAYYGYIVDGLFHSQEEADTYTAKYGNPFGQKFMAGDFRIRDANGDGKLNAEDRRIIGNRFPKFTFGGKFFVAWKNIDLSVMFQGATKVNRYYTETTTGDFTGDTSSPDVAWLDAWSADNPNGKWPRAAEGVSSPSHQRHGTFSFWCPSTSYVRVKNIQIGYNLPKKWVSTIGLNNIRFYYSGENLFTITNMKLKIDPESPDGNAYIYPPMKTNSFGVNVTF